jgi:hypothetical protein
VHPLILRSANSGPDLFYLRETLTNHFRSLIAYGGARPLLYLFGKYALYKPPHLATFEVLGAVDYGIGFAHRDPMWIFVDWKKRTLAEAFKPRADRLRFHAPKTGVEAALAPKFAALRQAAADLRERSRIFLRAIRWQRQVEVNAGAWEQEVARRLAEVLGRAAILYEKDHGAPPADLAGLVDFASKLSSVDGRLMSRLTWDPKSRKVGVRP